MAVEKSLQELKNAIIGWHKKKASKAHDPNMKWVSSLGIGHPDAEVFFANESKLSFTGFQTIKKGYILPPGTPNDLTIIKAFYNIWADLNCLFTSSIAKSSLIKEANQKNFQNDLNTALETLLSFPAIKDNAVFLELAPKAIDLIIALRLSLDELGFIAEFIPLDTIKSLLFCVQFLFESAVKEGEVTKCLRKLENELAGKSPEEKIKLIETTQFNILNLFISEKDEKFTSIIVIKGKEETIQQILANFQDPNNSDQLKPLFDLYNDDFYTLFTSDMRWIYEENSERPIVSTLYTHLATAINFAADLLNKIDNLQQQQNSLKKLSAKTHSSTTTTSTPFVQPIIRAKKNPTDMESFSMSDGEDQEDQEEKERKEDTKKEKETIYNDIEESFNDNEDITPASDSINKTISNPSQEYINTHKIAEETHPESQINLPPQTEKLSAVELKNAATDEVPHKSNTLHSEQKNSGDEIQEKIDVNKLEIEEISPNSLPEELIEPPQTHAIPTTQTISSSIIENSLEKEELEKQDVIHTTTETPTPNDSFEQVEETIKAEPPVKPKIDEENGTTQLDKIEIISPPTEPSIISQPVVETTTQDLPSPTPEIVENLPTDIKITEDPEVDISSEKNTLSEKEITQTKETSTNQGIEKTHEKKKDLKELEKTHNPPLKEEVPDKGKQAIEESSEETEEESQTEQESQDEETQEEWELEEEKNEQAEKNSSIKDKKTYIQEKETEEKPQEEESDNNLSKGLLAFAIMGISVGLGFFLAGPVGAGLGAAIALGVIFFAIDIFFPEVENSFDEEDNMSLPEEDEFYLDADEKKSPQYGNGVYHKPPKEVAKNKKEKEIEEEFKENTHSLEN